MGRIWSFVLGFRSLVARLVPFERGGTKPEGEKIFGNGKCELIANFSATMVTSPRRERREVWREKRKVRIFGKGKCKLIANSAIFLAVSVNSSPILARQWWRHFRLSLSLCLYLSLSLSHRKYLTHNIGSASALPIIITIIIIIIITLTWCVSLCIVLSRILGYLFCCVVRDFTVYCF